MTNIDKWFLTKLEHIFKMEQALSYVLSDKFRSACSDKNLGL